MVIVLTVKFFLLLLLISSATAFLSLRVPPSQHVTSSTVCKNELEKNSFVPASKLTIQKWNVCFSQSTCLFEGQKKKLGHLEDLPNPWKVFDGTETETDCPGIPVGADVWPSPVTEPRDVELGATDTPGIPKGASLWPSPMREPYVPNDTPSDCPGLPPRGSESLPPFIQEPRIP
jgi:hypothetical protein